MLSLKNCWFCWKYQPLGEKEWNLKGSKEWNLKGSKEWNLKSSKEYEPCLFSVWLVTCPKLFFPLGQDLPISRQKHLEEICLWWTDVSNLSNDFKWYRNCECDGVIQIKLNVG